MELKLTDITDTGITPSRNKTYIAFQIYSTDAVRFVRL